MPFLTRLRLLLRFFTFPVLHWTWVVYWYVFPHAFLPFKSSKAYWVSLVGTSLTAVLTTAFGVIGYRDHLQWLRLVEWAGSVSLRIETRPGRTPTLVVSKPCPSSKPPQP